jgi:hypothetical protein
LLARQVGGQPPPPFGQAQALDRQAEIAAVEVRAPIDLHHGGHDAAGVRVEHEVLDVADPRTVAAADTAVEQIPRTQLHGRLAGRRMLAQGPGFIDFLAPRHGERPAWDAWMSGATGDGADAAAR